jgi:hypothetical protein
VKEPREESIWRRLIRSPMSHGAFRLWHLLRDRMDQKTRESWPGRRFIQRTLGCSNSSIAKWIRQLEELDWIRVKKGKNGRGNVYVILDGIPENRSQNQDHSQSEKAVPKQGPERSYSYSHSQGQKRSYSEDQTGPKKCTATGPTFRTLSKSSSPIEEDRNKSKADAGDSKALRLGASGESPAQVNSSPAPPPEAYPMFAEMARTLRKSEEEKLLNGSRSGQPYPIER